MSRGRARGGRGAGAALAALFVAGALVGCGGRLPAPTTADATRAQRTWKDTTVAELELGRHIYAERCSACHTLFAPVRFPAQRWPSLVSRMSERARLLSADGQAVTRYLMVMADAGTGAQAQAESPAHVSVSLGQ